MEVLVVAGSDPSGWAGFQMDLRVLALLGVSATAVPSAFTVQTAEEAFFWEPVPEALFEKALVAALPGVRVVKVGMLGKASLVRTLARVLADFPGPVVLDPVLSASSGLPLAEPALGEVLKKELLPRVTLLTPNLPEAEALLGRRIEPGGEAEAAKALGALGPRAVLLKGGHGEGPEVRDFFWDGRETKVFRRPRLLRNFRGTGCFLASTVAGLLSQEKPLPQAVAQAEDLLSLALQAASYRDRPGAEAGILWERLSEGRQVLEALAEAAEEFCTHPVRPLIPEVQTNLAYALPLARGPEEVAAFPGRIVGYGKTARPVGCPAFGASSHVARIVLAALRFDPEKRAAMNIRYEEEFLKRAEALGLRVAHFSRTEEPEEIKRREGGTLSWAVTAVCQRLGYVPDLIADPGDLGKEPMIRILARSPQEAVRLALKLLP
ncbi:hypothetical protein FVE67_03190 [Thermosulfurimonas marina]|uniref:hydroxymethylpyrimidine kinase n=1 Tax=Thermosulfurimonas marina TaxID=2047767 RepID=A0A6H1WRQ4_9BACT|nr:thiamine-phosphate synthase family protein [Thermosulfurimonas marina]QJA05861.1 hypothetical protein FVE67_03190 [Thermosulfurimonas marina]